MNIQPDVATGLRFIAQKLTTDLVAQMNTEYAMADAGLLGYLLLAAAEEAEHGAANRLADLAEMRALFADAADAQDGSLAGRLRAEADRRETCFEISALDAACARCKTLLIELHEAVEASGDARLDGRIWALYEAMSERHALQVEMG